MTTTTQQRRDQLAGWYDLATKVIGKELTHYLGEVAKAWPEVEFGDDGFTIKDPVALANRMKREGWPP